MKLSSLLQYDNIVIQCHDNPDADAICSGYVLFRYFESYNKKVRFIYSGNFEISKSNLVYLIKKLRIPIEYVDRLTSKPDLLLMTDCQYGEGNVRKFNAKDIAVIDHHQVSGNLPKQNEVRSNLGSSCTVIWNLLKIENEEKLLDKKISTDNLQKIYTGDKFIEYSCVNKKNINLLLEKIYNIFLDFQKRATENNNLLNLLSTKKIELNSLQNELENEQKIKLSNRKIEISNKINEINNKIHQKQINIESMELSISNFEKQRNELREKWNEVNNRQFEEPTSEFLCPTCKQELPETQKEQKISELRNNFTKQKQSELDNINAQGTKAKENQEKYESELNSSKEQLDTFQKELEILNKEIIQVDDDINSLQVANYKNNEDYIKLLNEVEQLEKQVANITSISADDGLKEQKSKAQAEIEKINSLFARKENIEKTQARITELEKQEEELGQQMQSLEQQQYLIEKFTVTKVELVEKAINSKFKVAKFKLFNTLINGSIEETCVTLINGVDFPDANHAAQILVGLDIIETLNNYYDISAPVFIDNSEAISSNYNINTQLIRLTVSNDTSLRVELENNNEIEVQDVKQPYEY